MELSLSLDMDSCFSPFKFMRASHIPLPTVVTEALGLVISSHLSFVGGSS
tara:strand:+ start:14 stop:163 length:150 start_codon:yes stop_codon:yes gene_type:complete